MSDWPQMPKSNRSGRRGRSLIAGAAVGLAAIGAWLAITRPWKDDPPVRSIAVLPFRPLFGVPHDAPLEFGLADLLTTRLGTIRNLIVSPTSAIRRYAEEGHDPLAAGRELGVESVLIGNVHRTGGRVQLSVRLLRVRDGSALWSNSLDQPFADIVNVEDTIVREVARVLRAPMTNDDAARLAKRQTDNAEAYRLYLVGRYHWSASTVDGWEKSVDYFERAVKADPRYALAHAGIADVHLRLAAGAMPDPEAMTKAKQAAATALGLDSGLAEAHLVQARVNAHHDLDWVGAGLELNRALELKPHFPEAYRERALYFLTLGETETAIADARKAAQLEPSSPLNTIVEGTALFGARGYDAAIERLRTSLRLDPRSVMAHTFIGHAYIGARQFREAATEFRAALDLAPDDLARKAELGFALAAAGDRSIAEAILTEISRWSNDQYVSPYYRALINAGLAHADVAVRYLEEACRDRSPHLWELNVLPVWDGLRDAVRFRDLLRMFDAADTRTPRSPSPRGCWRGSRTAAGS
jgi:TolB-like protein/tetratricopeptide (TPR) repeat protein